MRSLRPFLAFLLAMLVCLSGCSQPAPAPTTTTVPAVPATELYLAACQALGEAENLMLTYTCQTTRTVGSNTFTDAVSGTASFADIGKDTMSAYIEETLDLGSYRCSYAESYADGTAYVSVNGCSFQADLDPGAFTARQLPAVLLDAQLYGSIRAVAGPDTTTLYFEAPTALESWAASGAALLAASGSATLSSAGQLMQSQYSASYQLGETVYQTEVTLRVVAPKAIDLSSKPLVPASATALADLDAPRQLLQVVGAVYSAQALTCQTQETIVSQALPLTYQQTDRHTLSGFGDDLYAEVEAQTSLLDRRGQVSGTHQLEIFADGVHSVSVDGAAAVENPQTTAQAMRQACEDAILSGLFAAKYLENATGKVAGTEYRLEFQGNAAFQQDLMNNLSLFLQTDLDAQADSFETTLAGGYLVMDITTGLPTEMGLHFARTHTLGSLRYELTYELAQSLNFS